MLYYEKLEHLDSLEHVLRDISTTVKIGIFTHAICCLVKLFLEKLLMTLFIFGEVLKDIFKRHFPASLKIEEGEVY
jgi:hypothetical protein